MQREMSETHPSAAGRRQPYIKASPKVQAPRAPVLSFSIFQTPALSREGLVRARMLTVRSRYSFPLSDIEDGSGGTPELSPEPLVPAHGAVVGFAQSLPEWRRHRRAPSPAPRGAGTRGHLTRAPAPTETCTRAQPGSFSRWTRQHRFRFPLKMETQSQRHRFDTLIMIIHGPQRFQTSAHHIGLPVGTPQICSSSVTATDSFLRYSALLEIRAFGCRLFSPAELQRKQKTA